MKRITKYFLALGLLIATPLHAEREITIGYQGIVESKGELVDGTVGYFKFALCDEGCVTTYWSNDNSSIVGVEPFASVSAPITAGLFNFLLGDTSIENMAAIPISVFEEAGDTTLYLRVWFDDGDNGFEQFIPDQRVSIVPYAVRTEMAGGLLNIGSLVMTGDLNMQVEDLTASDGIALQIADPTRTLFSVDSQGTALSHNILLRPVTSSSELSRVQTGRIFYDGVANTFKACNNAVCADIDLAGPSGGGDISAVRVGAGLSGGGTSGSVTLSLDTSVAVTKSGNHTMAGTLTTAGLSAPTLSATTITATSLAATGTVSAGALSTSTTTTTGGVVMPPTGTGVSNTAEIQFQELAANGPHYVGFKAPDSVVLSNIWVLPANDGSAGQVLHTDGSNVLSWGLDDNAGGDITAVTADAGLGGGAITGSAGLNVGVGTGIQVNTDSVQFEYDNTLAGNPVLLAGQAVFDSADSQGGLLFEGTSVDNIEGQLTVADPTGTDKTWTLPNASGTVLINTNCVSIVAGEFNPTEASATDDFLNLVDNTFSVTETDEDMFMVPIAMVARNLRADVNVAPGVGNDPWAVTLRDDAASTTLTCTIDEEATSCTDSTNAPSIAAGSKLAILVSSAGPDADPAGAATLTVSFCLGP